MTARAGFAIAVLAALAGCRPAAPARALPVVRTAAPAVGEIVAVAEQADALYLLARDRLTIERGGVAVVSVAPPEAAWAAAATIPALDGEGSWVVARTSAGGLWRISANGDLEPIGDRLGIPATAPAGPSRSSIAACGSTVAIAVSDGVAVLRDARHVARFAAQPGELAAARDRIAIRQGDGAIELWDLAHGSRTRYAVPGAIAADFIDPGHAARLAVATHTAVFVEERDGLHRMAAPGEIRAMAVAGPRLWLATSRGLYVVEHGAFQATATNPPPDRLFGLAGGDVLIAGERGTLARLSVNAAADPAWAAIQPIFQRVCARCHLPGGEARVDLSTSAAWHAEHGELVDRVVETRTMPPAGTELSDADRRALASYLASH